MSNSCEMRVFPREQDSQMGLDSEALAIYLR